MPIKDLRVDLDSEEKQAEVRAKERVLSKVLQGNWNTILKGQGMEFAGFRTYTFEDDASLIDWKATLRSDETLVKEFEEYRNINVYILVDVSDTMLFTSQEKLKAEYAAELAFVLADSVLKAGDAVGMGMFTDKLIANIPPNIGQGSYFLIRKALTDPNNYGGKSNIKEVLKMVNASLKERSLVILISDFIGLEPGWHGYLDLIAQKMDIMGIMLRDPRDSEFPYIGGQFQLQDPKTGESMVIDTGQARTQYKEEVVEEEQKIKKLFTKTNSGFVKIQTDQDMYDLLLTFFYKRKNLVEL